MTLNRIPSSSDVSVSPKPSYEQDGGRDESVTRFPQGVGILLVDDNAPNREVLSERLRLSGFNVLGAASGSQALALLEQGSPAVVITDIQMPGMDGLELIRRIRGDRRYKSLPILALTALVMRGDREQCLAVGATEYIGKPVTFDRVLSFVLRYTMASPEGDRRS